MLLPVGESPGGRSTVGQLVERLIGFVRGQRGEAAASAPEAAGVTARHSLGVVGPGSLYHQTDRAERGVQVSKICVHRSPIAIDAQPFFRALDRRRIARRTGVDRLFAEGDLEGLRDGAGAAVQGVPEPDPVSAHVFDPSMHHRNADAAIGGSRSAPE